MSGRLGPVVRGFLALGTATAIGQVISFIVLVVVARRVGPENLGSFAFAQSFAMYFQIPIDFGITMYAIREVAREPERVRSILGEVLLAQLVLLVVCMTVTLLVAPGLMPEGDAREILPIIVIGWIPTTIGLDWALRSMRHMGIVAGWRLGGQVIYGILTVALVGGGLAGVKTYAWLQVLTSAIIAVGMTATMFRIHGLPRLRIDLRGLGRRYARGLVVGISLAIAAIYYTIDNIVLGYMAGPTEVGIFSAAYKIPFNIVMIGTVWLQAAYPYASALAVHDAAAFRVQLGRVASLAGTVSIPVAIGGTLLAHQLIVGVFGQAYEEAAVPFMLLIWSAVIALLQVNYTNGVLALGDEKHYLLAVVVAALANVGLDILLIPSLGASGAAAATVVAELAVLIFVGRRIAQRLGPPPIEWGRLARSAGATALMVVVLLPLRNTVPFWLAIGAGAIVYLGAAFALRVVTRDELAKLTRRKSDDASPEDAAEEPASEAK
ncbi:flippase [Conexibacter woesei]|uniref:flippase n=1 Tax=Conexibacter woesei TaxID=191495 RepID=UPI00135F1A2D|nr:flippase [Conexibacter woesei]